MAPVRLSDDPEPRLLRVPPGLFVLRYAGAADGAGAPHVAVSLPDRQDGAVLMPPGMDRPELVAPGDGLVVQALRDFSLQMLVRPNAAGSIQVHLALEPVSSLMRPEAGSLASAFAGSRAPRLLIPDFNGRMGPGRSSSETEAGAAAGFVILGHVANRGDVVARSGEWLGGADTPDAIEGIELRWPGAPRGMDVALRLTVNDHGPRKLPEAGLGAFAGTRRRAAPIIGLDLALEGRRPDDWIIECQAAFKGQALLSASGTRIALRGRTGQEPLTGLKLWIGSRATRVETARSLEPGAPALQASLRSRVRVFRSSV
jgi:hypothetical protein